MRIELSGGLFLLTPSILIFTEDQEFDTAKYIDLGFTYFDVICIGGAGGMGGGIDTQNTGTYIRSYGGAGGGGGFHRVKGLLSALPSSCSVIVGAGGAPGTEHVSDPGSTTDGEDGGYSSFNTTTCRASGGKGGRRVQSNSTTVTTIADGGDGGIGDRILAGGGGSGGLAGTPSPTGPGTPGTDGEDGTFILNIGKGGGGGAGGVGLYQSEITCVAATSGGRGSYNPVDLSVYDLGAYPSDDPDTNALNTVPGGAGGAKAAPLTGLLTVYGRSASERISSDPGIVIVRLTSE